MQEDGRADWCGLKFIHNPHSSRVREDCPGLGPRTNGERRMHGITKRLVESTLNHVNEQLRLLGMVRRYEFVAGSSANGTKHVIQTRLPELEHPTDLHKFPTLAKAYLHLSTVSGTLKDVAAERQRARSAKINGG